MGYIAGIGGANMDVHGRGTGTTFKLRDSNPGEVHLTPGGVVRNMLEVLRKLGQDVELCSVIGDDAFGNILLTDCKEKGIGTRALEVIAGASTSTYLDVLDDDGDMIAALCDGRVRDNMNAAYLNRYLDVLNAADLVLLDANLSLAALQVLVDKCDRPIFMDPVSTELAEKIRPFLPYFNTVKPNLQELETLVAMQVRTPEELEEAAGLLLDTGIEHVWVSLGERGLYYADKNMRLRARCHDFDNCVNATGAGDSTMAAIAWCYNRGLDIEETMEIALAAGMIAVSSDFTVSPCMSEEEVSRIVKEYVR